MSNLKKKLEGAGLNKAEIKAIMESVPSLRKKLKKGETKRGIGPAGGAPVSKTTGKVFTGHKGPKRSVGPAGAPVSIKTGKVFTGMKHGGSVKKSKKKKY